MRKRVAGERWPSTARQEETIARGELLTVPAGSERKLSDRGTQPEKYPVLEGDLPTGTQAAAACVRTY